MTEQGSSGQAPGFGEQSPDHHKLIEPRGGLGPIRLIQWECLEFQRKNLKNHPVQLLHGMHRKDSENLTCPTFFFRVRVRARIRVRGRARARLKIRVKVRVKVKVRVLAQHLTI